MVENQFKSQSLKFNIRYLFVLFLLQAVSLCLPALVPAIKSEVKQTIKGLQGLMLDSQQYGERRGGAYGLAGIIKGMNFNSEFDIYSSLALT